MRSHALLAAIGVVAATAVNATNSTADPPTTPITDPVTPRPRRLVGDMSCTIDMDIDYAYQGYDIANLPGASPTDCCAKCAVQTGCQVFTWTNWDGGTCWLKSRLGNYVNIPGAASAFGQSWTYGSTCAFERLDYVGNDIGNLKSPSPDMCCLQCAQREGCGAFTWAPDNGGTCYLKSAKGATVRKEGVYSGTAETPNCPVFEKNVDYAGNDIGSIGGSSAKDCCNKCARRSGCGAFTWTNWDGGTCWLKSGKGVASASAGAISAVVGF